MKRIALLAGFSVAACCAAQTPYGRLQFQLQNAQGQAISGAAVNVYTQSACGAATTGTPASLFADANGNTALPQPVVTDGFGTAYAYAPLGCYTVVYTPPYASQITLVDQNSIAASAFGGGPFCPLTGPCTISGTVTAPLFIGPLTGHASLDLPLTGGTLTGALSGTSASFTGSFAAPIFATSLTQLKGIAATSTNTPAVLYGVGVTDDQSAKLYSWQATNCASADDDVQVQPSGTGCWIRYSASNQMQGLATSAHFGVHNVACGIDSLTAGAGAPADSSCWQLRKILRASNLGNGGAGWELFYQGYTISTSNQYTAAFPAAVHATTNVKQSDSITSPTVWQYALAGRAYFCDGGCVATTDYMYWTPEDAYSSATIMYEWNSASGGVFNICHTGAAACSTDTGSVTITQGSTDAGAQHTPYVATIANTPGNYNLKMEYQAGQPVWVGGNFVGNPNGVTVMNFGLGGQTMATYDTLNHTAQQQGWAIVKPDVVILKGGMNDRLVASPATFSTYMQNVITDIQTGSPSTRIILEASHETGDYVNSNLPGYNVVLQTLATTDHLSFINDADAVGSYQHSVAQGWNNSSDVGSGATATCTFTSGGCSAYSVTAGGTLYTGPTYAVFKHDLSCTIYPTANVVTSAGVVTSLTPLTLGTCSTTPTVLIFGEQATCNASVQTGCDVHPSPNRGTMVEAAWLANKAFGIAGAYNPVAAYTISNATAPFPTTVTICPSGCKFDSIASGTPTQVLDLGAQQGTGHNALVTLKITLNRQGTDLMSKYFMSFVLDGTTAGPNTSTDCTSGTWLSQVQVVSDRQDTSAGGSGPNFTYSTTHSNSRCQILITPVDAAQTINMTISGDAAQGFGNTATPIITPN